MPRKFREARQINKLKVIEAARLGISQPTLSAWEGERKSPSLDNLENMADLYGVSTDYLLGCSEQGSGDLSVPISTKSLPVFHGKPVWSAQHGWMLVNAIDKDQTAGHFRLLTADSCLPQLSYFRNSLFQPVPH